MRSPDELVHLEGLDALRDKFPIYNNKNSPRIIALAQETAAQAAEPGRDATVTNAPAPATAESQPPPQ